MKTKWVATITVAILAVIVSAAFSESRPVENERQKRFDRNRDGQLDDREQAQLEEFARTSERAEKMRAEAKEHEEIARKLRAESEELARNLENPDSKPGPDEYLRNLKNRLKELDRASDRAAQAGNPGRAQALRQQAEQVRRDLDAGNRRAESARIRNEIRELGIQADKAQAAGNREKAAAIRKEAATLKQHLGEMENQPRPDRPRRIPHEPFPGKWLPCPMYQYPRLPISANVWVPPKVALRISAVRPADGPFGQNGLPVDLEQLRQQVFQLRRMLEEFYQMAGESPEY